jgi:hypothetical protein
MIKNKDVKTSDFTHSIEIQNGIVVREWAWIRGGQGNLPGPLGYLGRKAAGLVGFVKRNRQEKEHHPGA